MVDKPEMKAAHVLLFCVTFLSGLFQVVQAENSVLWNAPQFGTQKALGYDVNTFTVPPALKDDVNFWIKIYTYYTTRQGVFHISGDTSRILGEIDLTDVYLNPQWGPIRREKEAELIIERERRRLAKKHGIQKVKMVRLQLGLKDRMQKAIFESGKYLPMMEDIFEQNNIPKELARVVFVESSFNPEAKSRVGASGLWQIMPDVGRRYKYIQKSYDKRDHPLFATQLAADILKQNYHILNSWPLAVTSYNFGVGRMIKVRRKMGTTDANTIFSSQNVNKHIGFASRNFYATFLAALQVESHANIYFGEPFMVATPLKIKNIYLSKSTQFEELVKKSKLDRNDFARLNTHVESKYLKPGRMIPKGTLISYPIEKTADLND